MHNHNYRSGKPRFQGLPTRVAVSGSSSSLYNGNVWSNEAPFVHLHRQEGATLWKRYESQDLQVHINLVLAQLFPLS